MPGSVLPGGTFLCSAEQVELSKATTVEDLGAQSDRFPVTRLGSKGWRQRRKVSGVSKDIGFETKSLD